MAIISPVHVSPLTDWVVRALHVYCLTGIFPMGKSGCVAVGNCDRVELPNLQCMLDVLVFP